MNALQAERKVSQLHADLQRLVDRDPEQEVRDIAVPVFDAVVGLAPSLFPDDVVVQAVADVLSPERIANAEPVRAADALIVTGQLKRLSRTQACRFRQGGWIRAPEDVLAIDEPRRSSQRLSRRRPRPSRA